MHASSFNIEGARLIFFLLHRAVILVARASVVHNRGAAEQAMGRLRILGRLIKEMFEFMKEDKLWWMSPILILLIVLSVFIIFVEGSALAPLIYAMF
jgi:hypothetical protein